MDSRPRYLFSGDGFHPNTSAHAKIAQIVIEAFRAKYPAKAITLLGDAEIITNVLGMDPNIPYQEWIAANPAVPANKRGLNDDPDDDGIPNLLEFAMEGLSPSTPDQASVQTAAWTGSGPGGQLTLSYTPTSLFLESGGQLKPQQSPDLKTWADVTAPFITANPNGTYTATLPANTTSRFLRLKAIK